jgi:membrane protease YdiL (CAAX protease family)
MISFTLAALFICRRDFAGYGLTLKDWPYNVRAGLFWTFLTAIGAVIIIKLVPLRFDPLRPPDMARALTFAAGEFLVLLCLAWFLMCRRRWLERIPNVISGIILLALLALPLALAWYFEHPLIDMILTELWLLLGAGLGEEIFFRGYIQSRINQAFGRPWHVLNIDFGLGLIVSSLLFGFIHVLNTVDCFTGRRDFAWWWGLPSFVSGLFYGVMRERTGSIVAGGVHHGLVDVLARARFLAVREIARVC